MEIENPRRILCLGPPDSGVLKLLHDLTGFSPTPRTLPSQSPPQSSTNTPPLPQTTTAGTSHTLELNTAYYRATVPIWLDETSSPSTWAKDFMTDEAGEVVRAVGAWVVVFRMSRLYDTGHSGIRSSTSGEGGSRSVEREQGQRQDEDEQEAASQPGVVEPIAKTWTRADILSTLHHIHSIISFAHNNDHTNWDGTCLAIGMSGGPISSLNSENAVDAIVDEVALTEEWEDQCFEAGFEFVDCSGRGKGKGGVVADEDEDGSRNEFGERTGLARVKEALEAVEWEDLGDDVLDLEVEDQDNVEVAPGSMAKRRLYGLDEEEDAGFSLERHELEREFMGLKMDMAEENEGSEMEHQQQDVEQLDEMMRKMLAVKEMSSHLSAAERQRMARRVVGEVMGGQFAEFGE